MGGLSVKVVLPRQLKSSVVGWVGWAQSSDVKFMARLIWRALWPGYQWLLFAAVRIQPT